MIIIDDISLYFGKKLVLYIDYLEIPNNGIHIIAGDNGTGKSTLVRAIAGLHSDYKGRIQIDGLSVKDLNRLQISHRVSYLPQLVEVTPSIPVKDFIMQGLYGGKKSRFEMIVSHLKLGKFLNEDYFTLSGGQKQLCRIARGLVCEVPYAFLDEPDSYLSKKNKGLFLELIRVLGEEQSIVIITHADIFPFPIILELEEE